MFPYALLILLIESHAVASVWFRGHEPFQPQGMARDSITFRRRFGRAIAGIFAAAIYYQGVLPHGPAAMCMPAGVLLRAALWWHASTQQRHVANRVRRIALAFAPSMLAKFQSSPSSVYLVQEWIRLEDVPGLQLYQGYKLIWPQGILIQRDGRYVPATMSRNGALYVKLIATQLVTVDPRTGILSVSGSGATHRMPLWELLEKCGDLAVSGVTHMYGALGRAIPRFLWTAGKAVHRSMQTDRNRLLTDRRFRMEGKRYRLL